MADVSVIIPFFNAIDTIERSLCSVLEQTDSITEVIIIDDFSGKSDELRRIVLKFPSMKIFLYEHEKNLGASAARNLGVLHAKSKYLAFLDADDIWHPEKIKIQFQLMEQYSSRISGHGYVHNLNVEPFGTLGGGVKMISTHNFIVGNPFFTPTVMALREGFIGFDPQFRRVDDYKCWYENIVISGGHFFVQNLAGGFKPSIGGAGLTASVSCMHSSFLQVLNNLYRTYKISLNFYVIALTVEMIKYPIRCVIVKFRKLVS